MASGPGKSSIFGFIAGFLASIFGHHNTKPDVKNLKEAEFPTSTQKMGLRFSERIRDAFRFKWIKKL